MKRKMQSKASGKFTESPEYIEDKVLTKSWAKFVEAIRELTESGSIRWQVNSHDGWTLNLELRVGRHDDHDGMPKNDGPILSVTCGGETFTLRGVGAEPLFGLLEGKVPRTEVAKSIGRMWEANEKENQEIIACYRSGYLMLVPNW